MVLGDFKTVSYFLLMFPFIRSAPPASQLRQLNGVDIKKEVNNIGDIKTNIQAIAVKMGVMCLPSNTLREFQLQNCCRCKVRGCSVARCSDNSKSTNKGVNRRYPEITGEDNLTVFSYSGRVKSPEWRWQRRRADLRHFEIFRTYYNLY